MGSNIYRKFLSSFIPLFLISALLSSAASGQSWNYDQKSISGLMQGVEINQDVTRSALLNKIISVKIRDATVLEALEEVAEQAELELIYNAVDLESVNHRLTLNVDDMTINQALWTILEDTGFRYAVSSHGQLVIMRQQGFESTVRQDVEADLQITVTGQVVDAQTGEGLPGVNVIVEGSEEEKGSIIGTQTNLDGNYSINVPDGLNTLVFTYIGYQRLEVDVDERNEIDIQLQQDVTMLGDVVVVGYGVQRADEVTGAVSSVSSDNFVRGSVTDAGQLVQGRIAGLNIITPDANPTSTSQINLRGITTLMASTEPLVLIDGVPGSISQVSPQVIESIDVLKDGSAAAIYGTRGTNGVILITTKRAEGDIPPTIEINSYMSTQTITRTLDFLNADEYREKTNQGFPGMSDWGASTDWLKEVTQRPFTHNHDVSLMGGTTATNYTLSLRYSDQQGLMRKSDNRVIQPRLSVNHRMFDGLVDINANISGNQQTHFAGVNNGSYNPAVYYNALIFNPTKPVRDEDFVFVENVNRNVYANPVALIEETKGQQENSEIRIYGSATLNPIENLSVTFLGSRQFYNSARGYYETSRHISTVRDSRNGWAGRGTSKAREDLFEVTGEYLYTIQNTHDFRLLAGYTWNLNDYENYTMTNYGFPSDDFAYHNIGAGTAINEGNATESSYRSEHKLIGYFARLNYNYDNRYLFMASLRREGSSKFGVDQKWGNFPALSVGWNIHNESFSSEWGLISTLRLRAGFGITGTVPQDPYMSLSRFNFNTNAYIGGEWIQAVLPSSNPNPDLRWETKEEINIGVNFGLFDDRITGAIDVYERNTKDMLWNYAVPTPPYLFNSITANAAEMLNRGIEVQLSFIPVQSTDFQWNSSVNYSTNRNEVTSLSSDDFQLAAGFINVGATGEPIQQPTHRVEIGRPIGNFYGFKTVDIDENGHWIIEDEQGNNIPIADQQPDDRQVIGNGLPSHYLNVNNTFFYKNFDLDIQMRAAFDFQILNQPELFYASPVMTTRGNVLNSAFEDKFGKRPLSQDQDLQYVSYFIEDGDYLKISNITLGYSFNLAISQIRSARVYASASNIATFTGYSGIDPEVNVVGLNPGIDFRNRYPATRTFTFGVSLTF